MKRSTPLLIVLALTGCGRAKAPVIATPATVQPAAPGRVHLEVGPAEPYATALRITGYDAAEKTLYGPLRVGLTPDLELSGVPPGVTHFKLERLIGKTVLAIASVSPGAPVMFTPKSPLKRLEVAPHRLTLARGDAARLAADGVFTDGTRHDLTPFVSWDSSNVAVANVAADGALSTVALGSAQATCRLGDLEGAAPVAVTSPRLVSLQVIPERPTLPPLTTASFTAVATFSDGSRFDVTPQVQWLSTAPSVADIGADGSLITTQVGTSTVEASLGGEVGYTELLVDGPTPTSLSLGASQVALPVPGEANLRALASMSDGTVRDVTPLVHWSSSSPGVVAVTGPGEAESLGPGLASVTASLGSLEAATEVSAGEPPPPPPPLPESAPAPEPVPLVPVVIAYPVDAAPQGYDGDPGDAVPYDSGVGGFYAGARRARTRHAGRSVARGWHGRR